MLRSIDEFKDYPPSVKKAVGFTAAAWVWFYLPLLLMDKSSEAFVLERRFLMIGVCMLALTASMKNWARMVCIMGNVMAALFFTFALIVLINLKVIGLLLFVNVVLLLLSTVFLIVRPSAQFYRDYNAKPEPGVRG